MAFNKYKDGAWAGCESLNRYKDGAWVGCESAKKYKDGVWTDVWTTAVTMTEGYYGGDERYDTEDSLLLDGNKVGISTVSSDGLTWNFLKFQDNTSYVGSVGGGGYLALYVEGTWDEPPTVSFDWEGGFTYKTSSSSSTWYRVSAGSISLLQSSDRAWNSVDEAISIVGTTIAGATSVTTESGSFSGTVSDHDATTRAVGILIYIAGYAGEFYNAALSMTIKNLKINGKPAKFPKSIEFSNQDWG